MGYNIGRKRELKEREREKQTKNKLCKCALKFGLWNSATCSKE